MNKSIFSRKQVLVRTAFILAIALFAASLSACTLGSSTPEPTRLSAQAVYTAAAQTAESIRQTQAAMTPSPTPEPPTPTPEPTAALPPAAPITGTLPLTPTATLPGGAEAVTPPPASGTAGDRGVFVVDLTIPDGSTFAPGQVFEKRWKVRNVGGTTWTTDYALVFIDGNLLGAPSNIPLPEETGPDEELIIEVKMTAPDQPGNYRSYWKFRNASGQIFGMGPNANEAIWVDIVVVNPALAGLPTSTISPDSVVAGVKLSVDNALVTTGCPHTFVFTAQITLNKADTITYALEANSNQGAPLKVPPPTTRLLEAGVHTVIYELSFSETLTGWARLRIIDPETVASSQVDFTLAC